VIREVIREATLGATPEAIREVIREATLGATLEAIRGAICGAI
jgi:alkylhydroperoxidase/carboxymuconolactone decarboxylase family protein YurZ